jgi:sulfur relay (sulfurtransferase) DsrF/TusC family protein
MPPKTVLIFMKSKPFSILNYYEALRVSAGLWEHKVSLIWTGDGVYAALKNADRTLTDRFFEEFKDIDINLYVEEESLVERGFEISDVLPSAKVINREEISKLVIAAQASLVF